MCKWMDKVVDGVEVYQVGKQQLWDWCSWTSRGYDSAHSYNNERVMCLADSLRKGMYVVVSCPASFGKFMRPRVYDSFTSLKAAVEYAKREIVWLSFHIANYAHKVAFGYDFEVWHIVDDGDLWQEWDNASAAYIALHHPEVPQYQPVIVDEQDTDYGRDTLCSVYVPAVGQNVSFLVCEYDATGETVEYVNDDWQGWQPLRLDRICYLNWHSAEEIANGWDFSTQLLDSLRQLREAGEQHEYSSGFLSGSLARAEAFVDA